MPYNLFVIEHYAMIGSALRRFVKKEKMPGEA